MRHLHDFKRKSDDFILPFNEFNFALNNIINNIAIPITTTTAALNTFINTNINYTLEEYIDEYGMVQVRIRPLFERQT